MAERVRIGVVGVGFGSQVHIPAFQAEGLDVVAVCARHEERAHEAAAQFGIPHAFSDYREMLNMDGLDAVSVASPVGLHYPITMAALEAGKHVICEKPFSINQREAREMWQKAQATGLTAMIAHEFRFAAARMRAKELIHQGYIGALHMVLVRLITGPRRGFRPRPLREMDDASVGGGFLWALGSHYIDCLRDWFGEVESVSGQMFTHFGNRTNPDTNDLVQATADDTFQVLLRFAGGGWATVTGTNAAPFGPGTQLEIYGREGALITPHVGLGYNPPAHGILLGAKTGDEGLKELDTPEPHPPVEDDRDDRLMLRLLAREFLRGIREHTSPSPNFYDGFRCQQILDAVRESSATGSIVDIPLGL